MSVCKRAGLPILFTRTEAERVYNRVDICGINTAKLHVLSEEDKRRLLQQAAAGNAGARNALIEGNLRLVLSVVQRFSQRGESPDDLFQVGCIGLIKAIDRFDTALNVRFSTYAVPMIIGEIRRYLRDNNFVRVSRSIRDVAFHAMQKREQLMADYGREVTTDEVAAAMQLPREQVSQALEAMADPVSLYEPVYSDGGDTLYVMDQVQDRRVSEDDWVRSLSIDQALERLQARDRRIIRQRYFQGRTQMEVAQEIGISQAQVSRLEKAALQAMRKYI